jgi:hypothetical protein
VAAVEHHHRRVRTGGGHRVSETGVEGGTMLVAAGLSVWLINALYRFGMRGDREREDEDRARTFFEEHGYWPDEHPPPNRAV